MKLLMLNSKYNLNINVLIVCIIYNLKYLRDKAHSCINFASYLYFICVNGVDTV